MKYVDRCLASTTWSTIASALVGLVGFGVWEALGGKLPDKLFEAVLAISAAAGVISGFLGAGLLFLATVNNRLMRRIRVRHGAALHNTLLFSVAFGMSATLAMPIAALFLSGWGARAVLCVMLVVLAMCFLRSLVVIGGVLGSTLEDARSAR
ncbi:hypothetical protein [Tsukamurella tyrosinosolvens]|uniref:hypothetical protein n=1 Tax=Tsukamurella tyrosinosolvens TaxID=57704 RepID=UPI000C7EDC30|nr:hypothetical protein [Tsukamurella tyrosinosolvens]AUN40915.1 hypothetical protein ASU32_13615 [Tsukamurella tyrosinosolvens]